MAAERKLTVVLAGDARGMTNALGTAETKVGRFGSKVSGLGSKAKLAFAGLAAGAIAFGKSSVDAFIEAEASQSKLTQAYEKFPALAGGNIEALRSLNTELAKKTKFDDDATASGQAVLASFNLTQGQLEKLTPLMQDYAERTGKDLPTAAQDLGKAVLGQGKALKPLGINFKDTGTAAGNFAQLVGALDDKVGGFAETAGDTTAGKVAILKNQFGELQENVGAKLVPALSRLASALMGIGEWLSEHKPVMIAIAAVVGTGLVLAFTAWAVGAYTAAAATFAAGGALAFLASPITLIVAAVAALAVGVIYAYTHWTTFRNVVDTVARFFTQTLWPALQKVWAFIRDNLIPIVAAIIKKFVEFHVKAAEIAMKVVGAFVGLVTWFSALPGKIGGFMSSAWAGLKKGLAEAVRWILNKLDTMLGPIDEILGKLSQVKQFGQGSLTDTVLKSGALNPDGKRASGGPVRAGRSYMVGERGPELLTMGANGFVTPNNRLGGGGNVTNIYVSGSVISERELQGIINRNLRKGVA